MSAAAADMPGDTAERLWDAVMRLPLAGFYLYFGTQRVAALLGQALAPGFTRLDGAGLADFLAGCGTAAFMLVVAGAVLIRRRRIACAPGLYARAVAIGGTFFMILIGWLPPRAEPSLALGLASSLLMLVGSGLGAVVAFRLGRSFSILPEARRLVTDGPYRLVRHPLYVVEELVIVGVLLQFALPWSLILLLGHAALQLERMRLEETVLAQAFPEYAGYAARTARLIPGVY